ncbi:hypothetical protein AMATHDRAFT_39801 [Amanita thiersii Skay4041]|uniref:rRNA adenine N(6)-methyltransferase n=1 Tax=Amanita thiersii Skay4041 TaxID=703135 RepID=A0A2A9NWK8_9AGAR|nr:hypothetical protein AMATHDRAFT_39801 [Amanita thiersii Skay4041]
MTLMCNLLLPRFHAPFPRRAYPIKLPHASFKHTKSPLPDVSERAHLPPRVEWRKRFPAIQPSVSHRVSLNNPESARLVASAFVPSTSRDKVIIEAFPGPGQLTRALLELPKERIKKIIVLEDYPNYLEYLFPLETVDSRVKVLPVPGFNWDSYTHIDELKLLDDVPKVAWEDGIHPQLHFISHLPSTVEGEQLVAQLFRSIPDQQWLFQYGRVPMSFVLSDYLWKRISSPISTNERCKLTVIAEATSMCSPAVPPQALLPYATHFHPARPLNPDKERKFSSRRVGNPFQAVNTYPLEDQAIKKGQLDYWDFCLRRLFVLKATSLAKAIPPLAPGAQTLIKMVTDPDLPLSETLNIEKAPRSLTVEEWKILVKAFHEWPFAPEDLSIGDTFVTKERG